VIVLAVLAGGMLGAPARYLVDRMIQDRHDSVFPWGTFAVNVAGSAVLGFLLAAHSRLGLPSVAFALVGTGFCGGLTTFSTFGYETVRLLADGALGEAGLNVLGSLVIGVLAAWLGYRLAVALLSRPAIPLSRLAMPPSHPAPPGGLPGLHRSLGRRGRPSHVEWIAVGAAHTGRERRLQDGLTVRTVSVADPGHLLSGLPSSGVSAWIHQGDGLAGWGEAARLTIPAGEDRFAAGEKWLAELFDSALITDEVGVPGTGPLAFGSFTFDPASDGSVLIVPSVITGRRSGVAWQTTITGDGVVPAAARTPTASPAELRWSDGSLTAPQWEQVVAAAVARIRAGELRKVVLARDLQAYASADIDVRVLLARLAARAPGCYTFACAGLVGATPELLIQREGRDVRSLVLAGTMARGGSQADDEALSAALLGSAKNAEEHRYSVESVRDLLAPLCAELAVDPEPYLLQMADYQHLATSVSGVLNRDPSALALAASLHPTAAICGTPTEAALELIRELERMDRGRYSGPVGWVDARGNGEWGIALRCGEIDGSRARLFAGCGIVAGSQPDAELAETETKFRPMRRALEG
jgi:menaquinone-specific isochorismate synthase